MPFTSVHCSISHPFHLPTHPPARRDVEPSVRSCVWDHVRGGGVSSCWGPRSSRSIPHSQPQLRSRHPGRMFPGRRLSLCLFHVWPPGKHQGWGWWVCGLSPSVCKSLVCLCGAFGFAVAFYVAATWWETQRELEFYDSLSVHVDKSTSMHTHTQPLIFIAQLHPFLIYSLFFSSLFFEPLMSSVFFQPSPPLSAYACYRLRCVCMLCLWMLFVLCHLCLAFMYHLSPITLSVWLQVSQAQK